MEEVTSEGRVTAAPQSGAATRWHHQEIQSSLVGQLVGMAGAIHASSGLPYDVSVGAWCGGLSLLGSKKVGGEGGGELHNVTVRARRGLLILTSENAVRR